MNEERIFEVLRAPRYGDKSGLLSDVPKAMLFEVAGNATKPEIAEAVATLFNVKVVGVTTANVKPKQKRFRGRPGMRSGWKKAYVRLADGEEIDFFDGAKA